MTKRCKYSHRSNVSVAFSSLSLFRQKPQPDAEEGDKSGLSSAKGCVQPRTPRFHYLRGLESCPEPYLLLTTNNFTLLYALIIKYLKKNLQEGRVGEAVIVMER